MKQLTTENYAERDPTNDAFVDYDHALGQAVQVSGIRRAGAFLRVEIDPRAPAEVRELFEVARGTMLYGEFYYPLYTVGEEQLGRVADAAAGHRYTELGGPLKNGAWPTFHYRVEWLAGRGVIPMDSKQKWHAIRELRNTASHPRMQSLQVPGQALSHLQSVAELVSSLCQPAAVE